MDARIKASQALLEDKRKELKRLTQEQQELESSPPTAELQGAISGLEAEVRSARAYTSTDSRTRKQEPHCSRRTSRAPLPCHAQRQIRSIKAGSSGGRNGLRGARCTISESHDMGNR